MTNPDDLTDDEREEYEQQWQQLDEKVILAQILTELQQIRLLLSNADSAASGDADTTSTYRCVECQTTLPADDRARHAREQHKAPAEYADRFFELVDAE